MSIRSSTSSRRTGRAARSPSRPFAAALALAALALAGCATPQLQAVREHAPDYAPRAEVAGVPFVEQSRDYCGPASLAMVLAWSGAPTPLEALVGQAYTPGRSGALPPDVLSAARRRGRLAVPVGTLDALLRELEAGHPVLVLQNLSLDWAPQWHYAVAVGYDLPGETLLLRSGPHARLPTPLATFERTWARGGYWGLVVLPAGELPATAGERAVLEATAGLERAGRLPEAARGYRAALARWPESYAGWMGLGNARYGQGDLSGAADAFRAATARDPAPGAAWHNLALVLAELHDPAAAQAARQALALAPPQEQSRYREGLAPLLR
jgi:Tetratricopeptide repeat/Peptidase_C39 like family